MNSTSCNGASTSPPSYPPSGHGRSRDGRVNVLSLPRRHPPDHRLMREGPLSSSPSVPCHLAGQGRDANGIVYSTVGRAIRHLPATGRTSRPSPARSRHLVIDLPRDGVPADRGGTRKAHRTSSIERVVVPGPLLAHVSLESVHFAGLAWSAAMREYKRENRKELGGRHPSPAYYDRSRYDVKEKYIGAVDFGSQCRT